MITESFLTLSIVRHSERKQGKAPKKNNFLPRIIIIGNMIHQVKWPTTTISHFWKGWFVEKVIWTGSCLSYLLKEKGDLAWILVQYNNSTEFCHWQEKVKEKPSWHKYGWRKFVVREKYCTSSRGIWNELKQVLGSEIC